MSSEGVGAGGGSRARARAERREELLDAVVATIRSRGPAVPMDQLAAACGVTKPILYRHFVDRRGLVSAIAVRFVDALMSEVLANLGSDRSTRALLEETLDAYLGFIERDADIYRFVRSESEPEGLDLMVQVATTEIAVALRERLLATGLDPSPAALWAHALTGVALSAGEWLLEERPSGRGDAVRSLTTLLWEGFSGVGLDGPAPTDPRPDPTSTTRRRTAP